MSHYFYFSIGFFSIALLFLVVEYYMLLRVTKSIRYRIIVNGTRGKSSVTTYIAAGLRANGIKTFAKITGIIPTIILSDNEEHPIIRRGAPRVQEQFKMIRLAYKNKAESIVLECMSLHPENQRTETKALRPTLYVITNIGEDHFEEMGKTRAERVASICSAIPENSIVVTIQDENFPEIESYAKKKNTQVIPAATYVSSAEVSAGVFEQNINLALTAIHAIGLNADLAKDHILQYAAAAKSPLSTIRIDNKKMFFVNGFAVNDPPSAEAFIQYWRNQLSSNAKVNIILNTRADRPGRTRLFANWIKELGYVDKVIITGNHAKAAMRMLSSSMPQRILSVEQPYELNKIIDEIVTKSVQDPIFIGIGNIAGSGFKIIELMESRSKEITV